MKPSRGTLVILWGWWLAIVSVSILWQTQLITPPAAVLGAIFLLLLCPVFWMEIRGRALSSFLEHVFADSRRTFVLLFLLLLFTVKFYWIPGFRLYTMGDGPPHFLNTWMAYDALRNGEIPFWTNYWACGAPFLQFYPPLFSCLTAAILLLHENIFLAVRLVLTVLHLLSGFTLYVTVRSLGADRKAAFVGGIVYAMAPWHVFQLFHFNRFPVASVYTLLPLLFLSTEMLRRDRLAGALVGGLSFAGIAISHQGYAIFSGILFGLYTFVRSFCPGETAPRPQKAYLLHILTVGLLGIGMASFLLFPYVLEGNLLSYLPSVGRAGEIKGYIADNPYLATLFLWSRHPIGHSGYVGISLFVLGVLGLMGWCVRRRPGGGALLVCFTFSYYLVLGHHNVLYSLIPFVYSQFYAGRYLIFPVLFLSIGSGLSISCLEHWIRNRQPTRRLGRRILNFCEPRVTLILLAVFLVDLGPISQYRKVSPRYELPDQQAVYARIDQKRRNDPHRLARALDIPREFRLRKHGSLIMPFEAHCPTPEAGQFGTLGSYAYIGKLLKNARETLPLEKGFPKSFLQAMVLLNVRYLCTDILSESEARKLGGENFGGTLWLFTLNDVSPVLASARIEDVGDQWKPPGDLKGFLLDRWNPPDLPERIIRAMELDGKNMRAGKILVRGGPAHPVVYPEPAGPIRVDREELAMTSLELTLTAGSDCYLRISQSYYPYQRILLDGEPVADVYRSAMDFIVIPFPEGQHTLEVRAVLSPVRKVFLGISCCVLLLTLCLSVVALRRRTLFLESGGS